MALTRFNYSIPMYRQVMAMTILHQREIHACCNCDRILEYQTNCHIRPIPFFCPANGYTHTLPVHSAITRLD